MDAKHMKATVARRPKRIFPRRIGFTLLELLVVVMILGILFVFALPVYQKNIEREYVREADELLLSIYDGERAYFFRTGKYFEVTDPNSDAQWKTIHVDNPNRLDSLPADFTAETGGCGPPTCFKAQAKRIGGTMCTNNIRKIKSLERKVTGNWGTCVGW